LPIRDNTYDAVVSISTLEHIGMDNSRYTSNDRYREKIADAFVVAVGELRRVLKFGGHLFITVPYGKYQNVGWLQQFNSELIDQLKSAFGER